LLEAWPALADLRVLRAGGALGIVRPLAALEAASTFALKRFGEERARALFAGNAAHSMLPLERRPSAAVALALLTMGHAVGWPFPRGGSQALADALTARLRDYGG